VLPFALRPSPFDYAQGDTRGAAVRPAPFALRLRSGWHV